MFCPYCGTRLSSTAQRFCHSCGRATGQHHGQTPPASGAGPAQAQTLPMARGPVTQRLSGPGRTTAGSLAVKALLVVVGILMFVPFVISLMFGALFAGIALVAALVHIAPVVALILLVYWLFLRQRRSASRP